MVNELLPGWSIVTAESNECFVMREDGDATNLLFSEQIPPDGLGASAIPNCLQVPKDFEVNIPFVVNWAADCIRSGRNWYRIPRLKGDGEEEGVCLNFGHLGGGNYG